jgi:hypothetical protein
MNASWHRKHPIPPRPTLEERVRDPTEIPARACTCSFCTKHGGVWTSNPKGRLEVAVEDPRRVSKYAFGTRTAEFHICSRCGIVPVRGAGATGSPT